MATQTLNEAMLSQLYERRAALLTLIRAIEEYERTVQSPAPRRLPGRCARSGAAGDGR